MRIMQISQYVSASLLYSIKCVMMMCNNVINDDINKVIKVLVLHTHTHTHTNTRLTETYQNSSFLPFILAKVCIIVSKFILPDIYFQWILLIVHLILSCSPLFTVTRIVKNKVIVLQT
jgi:hypothetical protein